MYCSKKQGFLIEWVENGGFEKGGGCMFGARGKKRIGELAN